MSTIPKIAIAVHTYGAISPKVYPNHICVLSGWGKTYQIFLLHVDGLKVAEARNRLVTMALEKDCTHILFLDSDHIIDSSMLPCLLGNEGATAVSGLITKRNSDGIQIGYIQADEDYYHPVNLKIDGSSYDVDVCAFGCTLIDLSVFKDIEQPYFKDEMCRDKAGKLYQVRSDVNFCRDLKALGKDIRIDTRVLVGHVGDEQVFYPKNEEKLTREFQVATYQKAAEYLEKDSVVLDLGCGTGNKLKNLILPYCGATIGLDKDDLDLEKIHSLDKAKVVICADVIEHISNYRNLLITIRNSMDADSVCVISTPNRDTIGKDITVNSDHVCAWNVEEFSNLITESGFDIIEIEEFQEILNYKSIVCVCKLKG